jgi:hypothetical protein
MSKSPVTQAQIDAFLKTLTTWAQSLPTDQKAMLNQVLGRAKSGSEFALSDEQLSGIVAGMRRISGGEWMQWSARQY